jgi:hypothetical protein
MVDSYAGLMLPAARSGERFADASASFRSPAAQAAIRAQLDDVDYVVLGERGTAQLTGEARRWFDEHFERLPAPGAEPLDLWERRQ